MSTILLSCNLAIDVRLSSYLAHTWISGYPAIRMPGHLDTLFLVIRLSGFSGHPAICFSSNFGHREIDHVQFQVFGP